MPHQPHSELLNTPEWLELNKSVKAADGSINDTPFLALKNLQDGWLGSATHEIADRATKENWSNEKLVEMTTAVHRVHGQTLNGIVGKDIYPTSNEEIADAMAIPDNVKYGDALLYKYAKDKMRGGFDEAREERVERYKASGSPDDEAKDFADDFINRKYKWRGGELPDEEAFNLANESKRLQGEAPYADIASYRRDGDVSYDLVNKSFDSVRGSLVEPEGTRHSTSTHEIKDGMLTPKTFNNLDDRKALADPALWRQRINSDTEATGIQKIKSILNQDLITSSYKSAYVDKFRDMEHEGWNFSGGNDFNDAITEAKQAKELKSGPGSFTKEDEYKVALDAHDYIDKNPIKTAIYKRTIESLADTMGSFNAKAVSGLGSPNADKSTFGGRVRSAMWESVKDQKAKEAARGQLLGEVGQQGGYDTGVQIVGSLVPVIANTIATGAATAAIGGAAGLGTAGVAKAASYGSRASGAISEFSGTYSDNKMGMYDALVAQGMDPDKALSTAHTSSIAPAAAAGLITLALGGLGGDETVVASSIAKKGASKWTLGDLRSAWGSKREAAKAIKTALKDKGSRAAFMKQLKQREMESGIEIGQMLGGVGKNALGEGIEESSVEAATTALINYAWSEEGLENEFTTVGDYLQQVAFAGAVGAVAGPAIHGLSQAMDVNGSVGENLFYENRAKSDLRAFIETDQLAKSQAQEGQPLSQLQNRQDFSTRNILADISSQPLPDGDGTTPRLTPIATPNEGSAGSARARYEEIESKAAIQKDLEDLGLNASQEALESTPDAPQDVEDDKSTTDSSKKSDSADKAPADEKPVTASVEGTDVMDIFNDGDATTPLELPSKVPATVAEEKPQLAPKGAKKTSTEPTPSDDVSEEEDSQPKGIIVPKSTVQPSARNKVRLQADNASTQEHPIFGTNTWADSSVGGFPKYIEIPTAGDSTVEQIYYNLNKGPSSSKKLGLPTDFVRFTPEPELDAEGNPKLDDNGDPLKVFPKKRRATDGERTSPGFRKAEYTEQTARKEKSVINGRELDDKLNYQVFRSAVIHNQDYDTLSQTEDGTFGARAVSRLGRKLLPNAYDGTLDEDTFDVDTSERYETIEATKEMVAELEIPEEHRAILTTGINKVEARLEDVYNHGGGRYYQSDEDGGNGVQVQGQTNLKDHVEQVEALQKDKPVKATPTKEYTLDRTQGSPKKNKPARLTDSRRSAKEVALYQKRVFKGAKSKDRVGVSSATEELVAEENFLPQTYVKLIEDLKGRIAKQKLKGADSDLVASMESDLNALERGLKVSRNDAKLSKEVKSDEVKPEGATYRSLEDHAKQRASISPVTNRTKELLKFGQPIDSDPGAQAQNEYDAGLLSEDGSLISADGKDTHSVLAKDLMPGDITVNGKIKGVTTTTIDGETQIELEYEMSPTPHIEEPSRPISVVSPTPKLNAPDTTTDSNVKLNPSEKIDVKDTISQTKGVRDIKLTKAQAKNLNVGDVAPDGDSVIITKDGDKAVTIEIDKPVSYKVKDGKRVAEGGVNQAAARKAIESTYKKHTSEAGTVTITPVESVAAYKAAVEAQFPGLKLNYEIEPESSKAHGVSYHNGTIYIGRGAFNYAKDLMDGDMDKATEYLASTVSHEVRHHIAFEEVGLTELTELGKSLYADGRINDLREVYPDAAPEDNNKLTDSNYIEAAAEYLALLGDRVTQGLATADLVNSRSLGPVKRFLEALKRAYQAVARIAGNADIRLPLSRIEAKLASLSAAPSPSALIEASMKGNPKRNRPKKAQTRFDSSAAKVAKAQEVLLEVQKLPSRGSQIGESTRQGEGVVAFGEDGNLVLRYEADVFPTTDTEDNFKVGKEELPTYAEALEAVEVINAEYDVANWGSQFTALLREVADLNGLLGSEYTAPEIKGNANLLYYGEADPTKRVVVGSVRGVPTPTDVASEQVRSMANNINDALVRRDEQLKTLNPLIDAVGSKHVYEVVSDPGVQAVIKARKNHENRDVPTYSKHDPLTYHLSKMVDIPFRHVSKIINGGQTSPLTPNAKFFEEMNDKYDGMFPDYGSQHHGGSSDFLEQYLGKDGRIRIPTASKVWDGNYKTGKGGTAEGNQLAYRKAFTLGASFATPYINAFIKGDVSRQHLNMNLGVHKVAKGTSLDKAYNRLETATKAVHDKDPTVKRGTSDFFAQPAASLKTKGWLNAFTDYLAAIKQMAEGADTGSISPIEMFAVESADTFASLQKRGWPAEDTESAFLQARIANDVSSEFAKNVKSSIVSIISNDTADTKFGLVFNTPVLDMLELKYDYGVITAGSVGVLRPSSARSILRALSDGLEVFNMDNNLIDVQRSLSGLDTREGETSVEVDSALSEALKEKDPNESKAVKRAIDKRTALGFYLHNGDADATRLFFAGFANKPGAATSALIDMLHDRIKYEDKQVELNSDLVNLFGKDTGAKVFGGKLTSNIDRLNVSGFKSFEDGVVTPRVFRDAPESFPSREDKKGVIDPNDSFDSQEDLDTFLRTGEFRGESLPSSPRDTNTDVHIEMIPASERFDEKGKLITPKPKRLPIANKTDRPEFKNKSLLGNPAYLDSLDELGFDVDSLAPRGGENPSPSSVDEFLDFLQFNSGGGNPNVVWGTLAGMDANMLPDSSSRDGFVTDGTFEAVHNTLSGMFGNLPVAFIDGESIPREQFGWNTSGIIISEDGKPEMMFIDRDNSGNKGLASGPEMALRDLAGLALQQGLEANPSLTSGIVEAMNTIERVINGSFTAIHTKKYVEFKGDKKTSSPLEADKAFQEGTLAESQVAAQLSRYLEQGSDGSNQETLQSVAPAKFLLDSIFDPNLAAVLASVDKSAFDSLVQANGNPAIAEVADIMANNVFAGMAVSSRVDTVSSEIAADEAASDEIDTLGLEDDSRDNAGVTGSTQDTNEGFDGVLPTDFTNLTALYTATLTGLTMPFSAEYTPIKTITNFYGGSGVVDLRTENQILEAQLLNKNVITISMASVIKDPNNDHLRGREGGARNLWGPLTKQGVKTDDYAAAYDHLVSEDLLTSQDDAVHHDTLLAWNSEGSAFDVGLNSYESAEVTFEKAKAKFDPLQQGIRGLTFAGNLFDTTANPSESQLKEMAIIAKGNSSVLGDLTHQTATISGAARVKQSLNPIVEALEAIKEIGADTGLGRAEMLFGQEIVRSGMDVDELAQYDRLITYLAPLTESLSELATVSPALVELVKPLVDHVEAVSDVVNLRTGEVSNHALLRTNPNFFAPTDAALFTSLAEILPKSIKVPVESVANLTEIAKVNDFYVAGKGLMDASDASGVMGSARSIMEVNEKYIILPKGEYAQKMAQEAVVDNWMQREYASAKSTRALRGKSREGSQRMLLEQGRSPDTPINNSIVDKGLTETIMDPLVNKALIPAFLPDSTVSEAKLNQMVFATKYKSTPVLGAPTGKVVSTKGKTGKAFSKEDIANFGLNVRGAIPEAQTRLRDHLYNTNLIYKDMVDIGGEMNSDLKHDIDSRIAMMVGVANDASYSTESRQLALGALKGVLVNSDFASLLENFNAVLAESTFTDFAKFVIAGKSKKSHTNINKSRFIDADPRTDKFFSRSIESQAFFHNTFNMLDSGISGMTGRNGASSYMSKVDKRIRKALKKVGTVQLHSAAYSAAIATSYDPNGDGFKQLSRNVAKIADGLSGLKAAKLGGVDGTFAEDIEGQIRGVEPVIDKMQEFLDSKRSSNQGPVELFAEFETFLEKNVLNSAQMGLIKELRSIFKEARPGMEYLAALRGDVIGRFENYVPIKAHKVEDLNDNLYDSELNIDSNPNRSYMKTRFSGGNSAFDFHAGRVPMSTLKGVSYAAYTKSAYSYFADAYGSEADNAVGNAVTPNPSRQHYKRLIQAHGAAIGPKAMIIESGREYVANAVRTQFANDYGQAKIDGFISKGINAMTMAGMRQALTSLNQLVAQSSAIAGYAVNNPVKFAKMIKKVSGITGSYLMAQKDKLPLTNPSTDERFYDRLQAQFERHLPALANRAFDGMNEMNNLTRATKNLENAGFVGESKHKLKQAIHVFNKGGEGLAKATVGLSDAAFLISIVDTEYEARTGKSLADTAPDGVDRVALNEARMAAEGILAQSDTTKKGAWYQKYDRTGKDPNVQKYWAPTVDNTRRILMAYANDPISAANRASAGISMMLEGEDGKTRAAGVKKMVNVAVRSFAYNLSKPAAVIALIALSKSDGDDEEYRRLTGLYSERFSYDTPIFKQRLYPMPKEHINYRVWGAGAVDSVGAFLPGSAGAVASISSINNLLQYGVNTGIEEATDTDAPDYQFTHQNYYDGLNLLGPVAAPVSNMSKYGAALFQGERDYYVGPEDLYTMFSMWGLDRDTTKARLQMIQERSNFQYKEKDYDSRSSSIPKGFSWNSMDKFPDWAPELKDITKEDTGVIPSSQPLGANGLYSPVGKAQKGWFVEDKAKVFFDKTDDGDSFMVDNNGHYTKFRAYGVDTAETTYTVDNASRVIEQAGRNMPGGGDVIHEMKIGKEAKARLRTLSVDGNVIIVTQNKSVIDKDRGKEKDRRYAQIIVNIDGQHVSWSEYMLANGLATVVTKSNTTPVISPFTGEDLKPRYKKLEAHAKANRLGRYENL